MIERFHREFIVRRTTMLHPPQNRDHIFFRRADEGGGIGGEILCVSHQRSKPRVPDEDLEEAEVDIKHFHRLLITSICDRSSVAIRFAPLLISRGSDLSGRSGTTFIADINRGAMRSASGVEVSIN